MVPALDETQEQPFHPATTGNIDIDMDNQSNSCETLRQGQKIMICSTYLIRALNVEIYRLIRTWSGERCKELNTKFSPPMYVCTNT